MPCSWRTSRRACTLCVCVHTFVHICHGIASGRSACSFRSSARASLPPLLCRRRIVEPAKGTDLCELNFLISHSAHPPPPPLYTSADAVAWSGVASHATTQQAAIFHGVAPSQAAGFASSVTHTHTNRMPGGTVYVLRCAKGCLCRPYTLCSMRRVVMHITIRKLNANIISSYLTCTRRFQQHIFTTPTCICENGEAVVGVGVGVGVGVVAYLL